MDIVFYDRFSDLSEEKLLPPFTTPSGPASKTLCRLKTRSGSSIGRYIGRYIRGVGGSQVLYILFPAKSGKVVGSEIDKKSPDVGEKKNYSLHSGVFYEVDGPEFS